MDDHRSAAGDRRRRGDGHDARDARDVLGRLRAANPVPGTTLSAAERQRAERDLAAILDGEAAGAAATGGDVTAGGAGGEVPSGDATGAVPASLDAHRRARRLRGRANGDGRAPGTRRRTPVARGLLAAAAAVVLVVGAVVAVPGLRDSATPEAGAADLLTSTAQAVDRRADGDVPPTARDYQGRTDADATGSVVTTTQVGRDGGTARVTVTTTDRLSPALRALADTRQRQAAAGTPAVVTPTGEIDLADLRRTGADRARLTELIRAHWGDDVVRGAVGLLTTPGLAGDQQRELYLIVADAPGNTVTARPGSGDDATATVTNGPSGLDMTFLPATGQLTQVRGLVADGVTTTVDAAGIVDCVNVVGTEGPRSVSLACGDNNDRLSDLTWTGWGSPRATATGTEWANDCDPSCAESTVRPHRVRVTADTRRSCGYNLTVYTRLRVEGDDAARDPADPGAGAGDAAGAGEPAGGDGADGGDARTYDMTCH
ncbi:hypothetical protein [Corynebacterium bovis]|uniref:Uncharacterized protein n=3 Tax=Corynebacterium bovis TaxID=36808 RepID=A0A426Q4L9_9CORY|nr:hypothetical protein [Corynebacterium bovis]RRO99617.1 hypothetical protein CXF41_09240 [Corynebacterium bovis]RRQ03724.1 hypothetical protein CXF42_06395 [Corynebacterium bovis]RRQ06360.1 hypothetical protein CXF43_09085 [Corynebacterium bovis]RRQ10511.1 hypothetical protein CXF44_04405 [Corynebacterium bovis]